MKNITNKLTKFEAISPPETEITTFEKNKCILYTFTGNVKGYGYINSDKIEKIDIINNIIYKKDTEKFVNVLNECQPEIGSNNIHYEVLFILDCKIEAFLALVHKICY